MADSLCLMSVQLPRGSLLDFFRHLAGARLLPRSEIKNNNLEEMEALMEVEVHCFHSAGWRQLLL